MENFVWLSLSDIGWTEQSNKEIVVLNDAPSESFNQSYKWLTDINNIPEIGKSFNAILDKGFGSSPIYYKWDGYLDGFIKLYNDEGSSILEESKEIDKWGSEEVKGLNIDEII